MSVFAPGARWFGAGSVWRGLRHGAFSGELERVWSGLWKVCPYDVAAVLRYRPDIVCFIGEGSYDKPAYHVYCEQYGTEYEAVFGLLWIVVAQHKVCDYSAHYGK